MNQQSTVSLKASGGALLLNLTKAAFQPRRLLQRQEEEEEEAYFVDYSPPARDSITLPRNVVYVLVGVVLVTVATYAIVGHLIKDLIHDLADCIFGPKPVEEDLEEEREEVEGDVRLSGGGGVRSALMQKDKLRMEKEKEGLLPGFHHDDSGFRPPPFPPPLRSASSSSYPREKRTSTHSVTFVCPVAPYVTSL